MILLKLIFFFLIVGVLFVLFVGLAIAAKVRAFFSQITGGGASSAPDSGGYAEPQARPDGSTVIDARSQRKAARKIFDKHDGEYVDFEES